MQLVTDVDDRSVVTRRLLPGARAELEAGLETAGNAHQRIKVHNTALRHQDTVQQPGKYWDFKSLRIVRHNCIGVLRGTALTTQGREGNQNGAYPSELFQPKEGGRH